MLSSIHPLGEQGRGFRYGATSTSFILGSIAGGLTTGAVFGGAGMALGWVLQFLGAPLGSGTRVGLVAVAAAAALVVDRSGVRLPSVRRQVNEEWLHEFRGWVYGIGFGFQLGSGVLTYITAAAVALWLATMLVVGALPEALIIGAAFGLARGLSILAVSGVHSADDLRRFHQALHARARQVHNLGSMGLVVLLLTAGVAAVNHIGWMV